MKTRLVPDKNLFYYDINVDGEFSRFTLLKYCKRFTMGESDNTISTVLFSIFYFACLELKNKINAFIQGRNMG